MAKKMKVTSIKEKHYPDVAIIIKDHDEEIQEDGTLEITYYGFEVFNKMKEYIFTLIKEPGEENELWAENLYRVQRMEVGGVPLFKFSKLIEVPICFDDDLFGVFLDSCCCDGDEDESSEVQEELDLTL